MVEFHRNTHIVKAKKVISNTLNNNEKILKEPQPIIEVVEMADSSVNLAVRPWSKTKDYWEVFFSANQKIKEGLDKGGIR